MKVIDFKKLSMMLFQKAVSTFGIMLYGEKGGMAARPAHVNQ